MFSVGPAAGGSLFPNCVSLRIPSSFDHKQAYSHYKNNSLNIKIKYLHVIKHMRLLKTTHCMCN